MERRLVRAKQVRERVGGISLSTLYRWMADNTFPQPVQLSGRSVAWDSAAIDHWVAERLAGPRTKAALPTPIASRGTS